MSCCTCGGFIATFVPFGSVVGSGGTASLRPLATGDRRPSPHAAAMHALVAAVIAGERLDEMAPLCRGTQAAIMGRMAAETGRVIGWQDVLGPLT